MYSILDSQAELFFEDSGAAYLRVGSLAIAAYDYVLTLPAEWKFYSTQRSWRHLSVGCTLFIALRYISITTLVISNVGYFGQFSEPACQRYYIVPAIFKILQSVISQLILGLRTYNISRQSRWTMWSLIVLFIAVISTQSFTNLFHRNPLQNQSHNCTAGNSVGHLSVWFYYVLAMLYDVVTLLISSYFLLRSSPNISRMSRLVSMMFYDGLIYFVVLCVTNVINLVLYRETNEEVQTAGASLAYTFNWILVQRLLIHLRDAAEEVHGIQHTTVAAREVTSSRDVSLALQSQFNFESSPKEGNGGLEDKYIFNPKTPSTHERGGSSVTGETVSSIGELRLDAHVQNQHTTGCDLHQKPARDLVSSKDKEGIILVV